MVRILLATVTLILLAPSLAFSQAQDPPKLELAAEFSSITRDGFSSTRAEMGFGGRVGYNINRHFTVEGAGYFFPHRCFDCANNGRIVEVVGGLKGGKRFDKWGIFAKARPGFVTFTEGKFNWIPTGGGGPFPFTFEVNRLTAFATDLGGVIEFYPSRRIVTRFDAGDTLIHFGRRTSNILIVNPVTNGFELSPFNVPAKTTHNFQFSASVGFRF
jgi:hypothetical protein